MAQKRSPLRSAEAVTSRPSARTTSASVAAAQGQAADAGGRDDADGHGQAERRRGVAHVPLRTAALRADRAGVRVHPDALHQRQVEHQPAVTRPEPPAVVAAAPHRQQQALVPGEVHAGPYIRDVGGPGDQARVFVDHGIIDPTGLFIGILPRLDDRPAQRGLECGDSGLVQRALLWRYRFRLYGFHARIPRAMSPPCPGAPRGTAPAHAGTCLLRLDLNIHVHAVNQRVVRGRILGQSLESFQVVHVRFDLELDADVRIAFRRVVREA
jgi:hypothetical protein